jgi:hypothetical protein
MSAVYLYAGWNNITFLGDTMLARDASAPIADYLIVIELLRSGVVLRYDPADPATHGLVLYFGEAIWVRVTQACWWEWVTAGDGPTKRPGDPVTCTARIRNTGQAPFVPRIEVTIGRYTTWGWSPAITVDFVTAVGTEVGPDEERTLAANMTLRSSGLGTGWHTGICRLHDHATGERLDEMLNEAAVHISV